MADGYDDHLGEGPDGAAIGRLRLANERIAVTLTNYGARALAIEAPDRDGRRDHVLLGFDRLDMILKAGSFNATLGRYANRIAGGRFTLDGKSYQLSVNDGANTLHGGKRAMAKQVWQLVHRDVCSAAFTLTSPDGDQGFPGEMRASSTYTLDGDTLHLALEAQVSEPCPVNLSFHPYFNLAGAASLDVNDHELEVPASRYLPTDAGQIPTGEMLDVAGTPFDFRSATRIGERVRGADPQLMVARGFDHCLVLDGEAGTMRPAARLHHSGSGRTMAMSTDCAGLQVYTGNSLDGSLVGYGGTYRQTAGLALEAQAFPDAPNRPGFPSTVLRPGGRFRAAIAFRFTAR